MIEKLTDEIKSQIISERTEHELSEGEQIKGSIRTLYENSRKGLVYTSENPLKIEITGVNGSSTKILNLYKLDSAVVIQYTDE